MSEEQFKKKKTAWQQFLDFGKGWGLMIGIGTVLVGLGVKLDTRLFSDSTMRFKTEEYINESPSAESRQRDRILDSINTTSAIKSRKIRDSLFIDFGKDIKQIKKAQQIQDSVNLLNADQIFQIKEQLKEQRQNNN